MNEGVDQQGCERVAGALLPPRSTETEREWLGHVSACPACAALFARRSSLAAEIAGLPRHRAPVGRGAALDFAAVYAQLDEARFERELEHADSTVARWFGATARAEAPATFTFERVRPSIQSTVRLALVRRLAACAAVLLVGVALWPVLRPAPAPRGFAAETAALSDRPVLAVRVVQLGGTNREVGGEFDRLRSESPLLPGRAIRPTRGGP